ncbi:MAG: tRNA (adenosine(37)-N6)-threonylcarbamoyltransferase complex dimerization subunit type 1 TsaB [Oceanospirillaceae bacterium]|nr:tRNA (adenosine(37)-N6)-threonylcarbamoyltransferase complex dimerization subunit type 1 TsaB [Oceanospirillaceae bacterium]MCP5349761.1 tRNA (adenosine(37)-N6)-threonylcarbamoyltransferase complex dimerization subunit type 1 TsaB [Oceanospirillaceae bacterium]
MSIILAIDAAADGCSVALQSGADTFSRYTDAPRAHSKVLYPMLDEVLGEAGINKHQLQGVAFGKGPGSFTGIRIAAATAQGLGFALDIPLLPVSSLQGMAQQTYMQHGVQNVLTILDARMSELYFGLYAFDGATGLMQPQKEDCIDAIAAQPWADDLPAGLVGVGNGWQMGDALAPAIRAAALQQFADILPHARYLLPAAQVMLQQGQGVAPEEIELVYLREQSHWKTINQQQKS